MHKKKLKHHSCFQLYLGAFNRCSLDTPCITHKWLNQSHRLVQWTVIISLLRTQHFFFFFFKENIVQLSYLCIFPSFPLQMINFLLRFWNIIFNDGCATQHRSYSKLELLEKCCFYSRLVNISRGRAAYNRHHFFLFYIPTEYNFLSFFFFIFLQTLQLTSRGSLGDTFDCIFPSKWEIFPKQRLRIPDW